MNFEQQARDMLERMGVENAQQMSAGEVVELANGLALLDECADHLAGALGAADRPESDSGELYARIKAHLAGCR